METIDDLSKAVPLSDSDSIPVDQVVDADGTLGTRKVTLGELRAHLAAPPKE
jgi:hypothetical protein